MAPAPDYFAQMLPGILISVLGVASLLAFPISILLLRLYRRAMLKSMERQPGTAEVLPQADEPPASPSPKPKATLQITRLQEPEAGLTPDSQKHYNRSIRAPWRAAAVYSLGGVTFVVTMIIAVLTSAKIPISLIRFLVELWTYSWPLILTLGLVAGSTRTKRMLVMAYFCSYVAIGTVAVAVSTKFSLQELFILWGVTNAIPTVLILAYLTRRVRAVGPLVLTFLVIALTGVAVFLEIFRNSDYLQKIFVYLVHILGLGGILRPLFFGVLIIIGCAAFAAIGWPLVQWIRSGYERKKISDQSLTLDSLWLLFAIVYSIGFLFKEPLWAITGLIAFLAYKIVVAIGFAAAQSPGAGQGLKLLLLRVFSLGKRSERLFDALGLNWRYLGPIQMIAGPDLATTTIEPHEFLEFLTGKLARRFIDSRGTLNQRLSQMDLKPDRDWRFRVNDFFCFADTWKMVLQRLVSESDAVLMDLRSFNRERSGCIFEIKEIINSVSLDRAVFIIDATTDEPFLRQVVEEAWGDLRPGSPNYVSPSPRLSLLHYGGSQAHDQLLRAVCAAARPA